MNNEDPELFSIERVIVKMLNMDVRHTSKWLRFRCPRCHNFHTATNRATNLARCFDCQENFIPSTWLCPSGNAVLWKRWNISRKECDEKSLHRMEVIECGHCNPGLFENGQNNKKVYVRLMRKPTDTLHEPSLSCRAFGNK